MDLVGEYLDAVDSMLRNHPEMREGQAHYVALRLGWPHLGQDLAGTGPDCYSTDRSLPAFLDWVEQALTAEEERVLAAEEAPPPDGRGAVAGGLPLG